MSKWRQKERLKTTAVALVLCLNIGVDPPDVIKISPCARLECWVDPLSMQPPKALETIGTHQLECLPRRFSPSGHSCRCRDRLQRICLVCKTFPLLAMLQLDTAGSFML